MAFAGIKDDKERADLIAFLKHKSDVKKKLLYMSTHRGCKEMDIILGEFAKSEINKLNQEEIIVYERLLMESDGVLFRVISKIITNKQSEIDDSLLYAKNILLKLLIFSIKTVILRIDFLTVLAIYIYSNTKDIEMQKITIQGFKKFFDDIKKELSLITWPTKRI